MSQYAMVIDLDRCVGCHACAVACRAEWKVPTEEGYRRNWVKRIGPEKTPYGLSYTFYPGLCNHCDNPVCVSVCPADPEEREFKSFKDGKTKKMTIKATFKEPFTGIVLIDKERCLGCGSCVDACPYGARYLNETLDDPKADKCTFCFERIALGEKPACVKTCIADARIFGDLSDPNSEVSKLVKAGAKRLESKVVKIGPNVYWKGKEKDIYALLKNYAPQTRTWEEVKNGPDFKRRTILRAAIKNPLFNPKG
ncbi:Molybdopterin oxydoreductase, iron-sulfur subunit B [Dissulfuribacter thermophilus]|uniref:Molybdopterin oxydoreductase, iron-sulfur subunit B n=1 Tax=Dissulfuribacter thermophilus TaxID=1156395 RepID=A0A1B9F4Y0_9BACT|nr:4Fe-4S dicluster domain-containing protein [Dissulfuribacter thermophilus]OCC14913.1 Molybdopterin oxydoreductase, iron-sulfur subunit B [Dissulfuribacter thermophilus]